MEHIRITKKKIQEIMKWNRVNRERAIKILNQVNENYRTGNFYTLEQLIERSKRILKRTNKNKEAEKKMKKTAEGKWNEEHIEKIYEYVNAHLNGYEISHLVDKFVWDKHYLVKTVKLITEDCEQEKCEHNGE